MPSAAAWVSSLDRAVRAKVAWPHPEWWTLGLSATAWLLILYQHYGLSVAEVHHHAAASFALHSFIPEVFDWFLMVVATMVPVVIGGVRYAAGRSLWHRRHRAIGFFLAGYFSPWMIAGAAASVAVAGSGMRGWGYRTFVTSGVFVAAAIWQLTRFKRQALRSCHRTIPLAPYGSAADRDCMRYGWRVGGPCVMSCGPLMMACMLAGHSLAAMALAGAISFAERYQLRSNHRLFAIVLVAFATIFYFGH